MSSNDVIVLNSILTQKKIELANTFSDNEYFEVFTFEQALKDYDLSYDELLFGRVDGADDGGIDGFFIFLNTKLIKKDIACGRKMLRRRRGNTCKRHPTLHDRARQSTAHFHTPRPHTFIPYHSRPCGPPSCARARAR